MLGREHLSRAAHAGLHFVDNQHDVMLIADTAQTLQEILWRRHVSAFALNYLNDNTGNFIRRRGGLEQAFFDPVQRTAAGAFALTVRFAERIAIFIRIRHMYHVERLTLEAAPLGHL